MCYKPITYKPLSGGFVVWNFGVMSDLLDCNELLRMITSGFYIELKGAFSIELLMNDSANICYLNAFIKSFKKLIIEKKKVIWPLKR